MRSFLRFSSLAKFAIEDTS
ncbi:hypothetical protein CP061683_1039A, partial [Chlamydia psittaci 06-1683]